MAKAVSETIESIERTATAETLKAGISARWSALVAPATEAIAGLWGRFRASLPLGKKTPDEDESMAAAPPETPRAGDAAEPEHSGPEEDADGAPTTRGFALKLAMIGGSVLLFATAVAGGAVWYAMHDAAVRRDAELAQVKAQLAEQEAAAQQLAQALAETKNPSPGKINASQSVVAPDQRARHQAGVPSQLAAVESRPAGDCELKGGDIGTKLKGCIDAFNQLEK